MNHIAELNNRVSEEVILPESPTYDELRYVFNRAGNPAMIIRPKTNNDIALAIQYAVDHQLKLSVRSGGHGLSGLATNDGGLVIDMAHYNTVEVLDTSEHVVRIGAGAKWGEVADALAPHHLALSSGDSSSVGVGGLTLGGGIGWLVRKYGLTVDSLIAAEIATANGQTLRVSEEQHPDLFWAIRGGGGNFGVVTSFEFRAQVINSVVGGMISYELAELETVLRNWGQAMRKAPEELNSTLVIFPGFGPEMPPQLLVYVCYCGDEEAQANVAIQPLRELGTVLQDDIRSMPYSHMLEDVQKPHELKSISESGFVKTLNDDVLGALAANFGQPGTPLIQIRSLGGAVARVKSEETAFAYRDCEALFWVATLVPAEMSEAAAYQKLQSEWQALTPFITGAYVNFLSDASEKSVKNAYPTATYERLEKIKATYDPDNVFNQNHNIAPVVREV